MDIWTGAAMNQCWRVWRQGCGLSLFRCLIRASILRKLSVLIGLGVVSSCTLPPGGGHDSEKSSLAMSQDLGQEVLCEGDSFEYEVEVWNDSEREKTLVGVSGSCDCTILESVQQVIPAHASVRVPVRFESNGKSGHFGVEVLAHFEDGEIRTFRREFYVKSDRWLDVYLSHSQAFGVGQPVRAEIHWSAIDDVVIDLQYDRRLCDISYDCNSASSCLIEFVSTAHLPKGKFEVPVTIVTDGDRKKYRRFMIHGYNHRAVEATNSAIGIGLLKSGESRTVETELYSPFNKHFSIVTVELDEGCPFTWKSIRRADDRILLELTVQAPSSGGDIIVSKLHASCSVDGQELDIPLEIHGLCIRSKGASDVEGNRS